MEQQTPRKIGSVCIKALQISFNDNIVESIPTSQKPESSAQSDSPISTQVSCTLQNITNNLTTSSVDFRQKLLFTIADGYVCEIPPCNYVSIIVKSQMNDDAVTVLGQGNLEFTDLESTPEKEFKDVSLSKDSKQIGIATLEIKVDPPTPMQVVSDIKVEDKNIIAKRKMIARKGSSSVPSSRDTSFRKLFSLPETETLLQDYSCSLFLEFLHHGRLYISRSYLCFYSKVFDIRIVETIPFSEIISIEQKDIFQGNQGIVISKASNVFNFGSFLSRDKAHAKLISLWKDSVNYSVPSLSKSEEISPGSFGALSSSTSEDLRSSQNLEPAEDDELGADEPDSADLPLISEKLPLVCSNIFEIAYGDEVPFTKRFYDNLGSTDLYVQKWNKDNFRSISYRSPAQNNSVTRVEEVQKCSRVKENTLIVETILYMLDIPYGDHFYTKVVHSYKGTESDCSINITANVHFTKKMLLEAKTRAQTIKLMKEKSEAFVNMLKEEIPKREKPTSIRRDESSIPTYSQVTSAIISRVPPKFRTFNPLQRPMFINGFICSIMGLAMIFLYIKILILEGKVRILEEKQNQPQLS